jgi:nucleotidyltransferase substrate binding protein (TIGR01987 family)
LKERLLLADAALRSLEEIVPRASGAALERDAAILRFQYSLEAIWKAAQHYLRERDGIETGSPKQTIRACLEAGLLDAELAYKALVVVDDRNLTVHTYNETLAQQLVQRLPEHALVLRHWLTRLQA